MKNHKEKEKETSDWFDTHSVKIERGLQKLTIYKKWSNNFGIALLLIGIIWTVMTSIMGYNMVADGLADFGGAGGFHLIMIFFLIFPLMFISIGLSIFYVGLCLLFNHSKLEAEGNLLRITHGPLPLVFGRPIPRQAITQIYAQKQLAAPGKEHLPEYYQLYYINAQNETRPLMGKLPFLSVSLPAFSLKEARDIEKALEDFFKIEDKPVANEVPKEGENTYREAATVLPEYEEEEAWIEQASQIETLLPQEQMMPTPSGLGLSEDLEGLFIFKNWKNIAIGLFFLLFAVVWNGVVGAVLFMLSTAFFTEPAGEFLPFLLILIPFVLAGILMFLSGLGALLNKTIIHVGAGHLVIRNTPISILQRGKSIAIQDIAGLELVSELRHNKNGSYYIYFIRLRHRNGSMSNILMPPPMSSGFLREELEFICEKLHRHLKLKK